LTTTDKCHSHPALLETIPSLTRYALDAVTTLRPAPGVAVRISKHWEQRRAPYFAAQLAPAAAKHSVSSTASEQKTTPTILTQASPAGLKKTQTLESLGSCPAITPSELPHHIRILE
jgi:hypothetical protein